MQERPGACRKNAGQSEIVMFDKAYMDFNHLRELTERGIYWVSRAKDNLRYKVLERLQSTDISIWTIC